MSKMLTTNEWIMINDIIYRINSADDHREIQEIFLKNINLIIPSIATCFFLADNSGDGFLSQPVPHGRLTLEDLDEYLENGQDIDYLKDIMISGRCMVYKETDFMKEDFRVKTDYYKKYYKPKGFHYCVQLILSHEDIFLGVVSLYNPYKYGDYTDRDLFILEILKSHLALSLYKSYYINILSKNKIRLSLKSQNIQNLSNKYNLTRRESEVLKFIIENYTNAEISNKLFISINTLKKHLANIYSKMEISNRTQLFKIIK